jgi:hypothetical protein
MFLKHYNFKTLQNVERLVSDDNDMYIGFKYKITKYFYSVNSTKSLSQAAIRSQWCKVGRWVERPISFLFGSTGVWTQGLLLSHTGTQSLELLCHPHFVLIIFEIGSLELPCSAAGTSKNKKDFTSPKYEGK